MTIPANSQICAGQLWAITDRGLFIVDRVDGPDSCYPIVLREVARHRKFAEYATGVVNGYASQETAEANARRSEIWTGPHSMEQERAWFALPSVKQWQGTVDEWKAATDGL